MSESEPLKGRTKSYSEQLKSGFRDIAGRKDDLPGNWPFFTISITLTQIGFFIYFYKSNPTGINLFNG